MFKLSNKHLLSSLITIAYCVFVLPLNERIAFTIPTDKKTIALSLALKLLFAIFFYSMTYFVLNFIEKLREGDELYKAWLKFTAIYLAIMLVVLVLIYPGHWVGDEFLILAAVKQNILFTWQNYFTNIFYTFCLYLIPTGVSIVLIQVVFSSFVVGYVLSRAQLLLRHKKLTYLLLIPFILLPVLINNLYPLRAAMCTYLELLLVSKLIFNYLGLNKKYRSYTELIMLSTLITLVSFWRTEGIYYLALFPILILAYRTFNKNNYRTWQPYMAVLACLIIIGVGYGITKSTTDKKYALTAEFTPLSTMVQHPLRGDHINQRLNVINKVINVKVLKAYPSYTLMLGFWNGGIQPNYSPYVPQFMKEYIYLVVHNPGLFLDNRVKTFLSTNSFYGVPSDSLGPLDSPNYMQNPTAAKFVTTNHFARPIDPSLKTNVSSFLLSLNSQGRFTILGHIFWNAIIPITLLLALGIFKLFKKQYVWAGIIALVLLRVPLIFLTAPANYFFYYMQAYVIGYFIVILSVTMYFDKQYATGRQRTEHTTYPSPNHNPPSALKTKRPLVFLMVGAGNTLVDFIFYTFLTSVVFPDKSQLFLAGLISGTFALCCAFATHAFITFRDKHVAASTVVKFAAFTGFGLWVIRPLLLLFFIRFNGLYTWAHSLSHSIGLPFSYGFVSKTGAFCFMIVLVLIYNYIVYSRFVFTGRDRYIVQETHSKS